MNDTAFGIRDGEVAIDLPDKFDASLYFIGHIRTPWTRREECPKNARESDAVCTIAVDARWAEALAGVETCSHLVVLYWMNRSRRDLVLHFNTQDLTGLNSSSTSITLTGTVNGRCASGTSTIKIVPPGKGHGKMDNDNDDHDDDHDK